MRWYAGGGIVAGAALLVEAALAGVLGPGRYEVPFGVVSYVWLVASVVAVVVRLGRAASPWLPAAYLVYAVADGFYGFYLVRHQPDPTRLVLPPWLLAAHAAFGLGYALACARELRALRADR